MSEDLQRLQQALGPQYQLGAELGRGGMATVYRARDVRHQRDLAVKVIDPALATAIGLERFQREIEIAAQLQHPNIVPLFDSGGAGDLLYFIMPFVAGESLRERLKRDIQLSLPDALAIVRDVAAALTHAHEAGVIHRDIKPENILLSGGKAMVADFGIARAVTGLDVGGSTETGLAVGTPTYMSPEQAAGVAHVDARTDIYSLGCVFYELLAGEPPFTGRTPQAVIARHMSDTPPSLHIVRSTVSEGMQLAVERALAKVPADRFSTAAAFAEALDAAYLSSISGGTRVSHQTRAPRPPQLVAVIAILGAIALVAVGVKTFARGPAPDPNRVVVYPLSAQAPGLDPGVGEQVALLIESALEHTEPLRWLDGQALLGPARNADARLLGAEAARLARRAGARYYLDGAIVSDRDSLTVIVRLHDAAGDSLVRQESATGTAAMSTAPQLALRAVARILPRLLPPNGRVDLSYIADRNPAAIADWLQGERAYVSSRFGEALEHMNRSLERDSAMGVAALKGAQAAFYLQDYAMARDLIDVSLEHEDQLPSHHRALADGLRLILAGAADSAVAAFNTARRADTTWNEPWMMLGETYYHMFPSGGNLDSLAERAMRTSLRMQPKFAPALSHLIEVAVRAGNEREAREMLRQLIAARPGSDWVFQAELTVTCALDGPDAVDWSTAVQRASDRVIDIARVVAGGGRYPACARRAAETVLNRDSDVSAARANVRWTALKQLDYQLVLAGQGAEARELLDSASVQGIPAAVSLHVLNAVRGAVESETIADSAVRSLSNRPITQMPASRLRYVSLWAWHRRDEVRLDSIERRLRFLVDSAGRGADRMLLSSTSARLSLIRGDSVAALKALTQVRQVADPSWLTWDLWESAAEERILLAQLQLRTGDALGAIATAEVFDSPRSQIHLLYLKESIDIRILAAERLGRRADAVALRRRIDALP